MRKAAPRKTKRSVKKGAPAARTRTAARGVREEHATYAEDVDPFAATMKAAERAGFLDDRDSRIAARVSSVLIEHAKRRTGIASDTDLVTYALAQLALEDDFADVFEAARGTIDPTLKLLDY